MSTTPAPPTQRRLNVAMLSLGMVMVSSFSYLAWYYFHARRQANYQDGEDDEKQQLAHHRYATKRILSHKLRQYDTFLDAIKNGDIESAVGYGANEDISKFMALITAILAEIPFGAEVFKQELLQLFEQRLQQNVYVMQSFSFFLYSYFNENYTKLIWGKHDIYQSILASVRSSSSSGDDRQRSRSKGKKPKIVLNIDFKDLIQLRKKRQKQLLRRLTEQLRAQNSKLASNYSDASTTAMDDEYRFTLSERTKLKHRQTNKKPQKTANTAATVSVDELEYDGHNILQLFEIFSFKYLNDDDGDDHKDDKDEDDAIHESIHLNISAGFRVRVTTNGASFCDPINGRSGLSLIQVERTFHSNAKPMLLSLYCGDSLSSQMIFKKGDDLRKDASILMMFDLFNDIWKFGHVRASAFTYKCIPMGPDYGCIEYVADCVPLTDLAKTYGSGCSDAAFIRSLVASSVGSYIASYVMGVRDRHSDNILIRSDGTLFHIDFGYVLGEKLSGLDASKFAITADFANVLGDKAWLEFVSQCVAAFCALREHYVSVLSFAKISLKFLEWSKIESFLMQKLMIGADRSEVEQWMRDKINKSPKQWKTKMKNTIHSIAMNVKK